MVSAAFKYCTSHKQQRRPMPSLLSLSFFYGAEVRTSAWGAKSNHVLFSLLHVIVECSVPNNKWHWLGLKKICSPCSPCRIRPIFSGSGSDLQMTYSTSPWTLHQSWAIARDHLHCLKPQTSLPILLQLPLNMVAKIHLISEGWNFWHFCGSQEVFNSLLPNVA